MKENAIIYKWIREGEEHKKEISRKDFYDMFDGIKKGFEVLGDNEISKSMVEIIPKVDEIFINEDINKTQDVPFIVYTINDEKEIMKIMRRHNIIWSILERYCAE